MPVVEKKQLNDVEIAKIQGGKTIEIGGEDYKLFEEPDVTIYCPKCNGTVFGYTTLFWVKELRCANPKCRYQFWRDFEGSSSVGGSW